jgi:hypothetical protein
MDLEFPYRSLEGLFISSGGPTLSLAFTVTN